MLIPLIALLGALVAPSSDLGVPDSLMPSAWSSFSDVHWQKVGRNMAIGGAVVGTIGMFAWVETLMFSDGDELTKGHAPPRSDIPPFLIRAGFGTLAAGLLIRLVAPDDPEDPMSIEAAPSPDGLDAQVRWRF